MLKKEVGQRLKESRIAAGYTQKQVAEIMQIEQPYYSRYERGIIQLDYEKLIFLCKLYHVSADYILGIDE